MSEQGQSASQLLAGISEAIQEQYVADRSLMSFDEYLDEFLARPHRHSRSVAQYLRDLFDFHGAYEVETPSGSIRRFKLFDMPFDEGEDKLIGHELAQNEVYEALNNFIRERHPTRLILLHGPNGSAKTSLIHCLARALEDYSRRPEGALYRFNWIFPTEKISRASIGFEGRSRDASKGKRLGTYAHLNDLEVDAKLIEELRDNPLLLIPLAQRRALLDGVFEGSEDFVLSDYLLNGELSHKSRQVFDALLTSHSGDYTEVLKHIQVERFYISQRYRRGLSIIEPQMRVDASTRQVTADRSLTSLPASLQNQSLFEPQGDLVNGNRGMIAFNDLLKRPLELNKYLISACEDGATPLEHATLYLDAFFIASANEDYLEAFKTTPDYSSFKGRLTLVKMPYMLDYEVERDIYEQLIGATDLAKPLAPHTTELAALWAVLTRLTRPDPEAYPEAIRPVIKALSPLEKARIYALRQLPDKLDPKQSKELRAHIEALFEEGAREQKYEGRYGVSPREMKNLLLHAAQRPNHNCLSPLALFEVLRDAMRDPSVYPFLQLKADGEYRQPIAFIELIRKEYLERLDAEVRACMGLIDESRYDTYFTLYVTTVSHWLKGEKIYNRITGRSETPNVSFLEEVEKTLGSPEDPSAFRNNIISKVGAFRIDNPDAEIDYEAIFPERFSALKESFYESHSKQLHRISQNLLLYIQGDISSMNPADRERVEETLGNMREQRGYCKECAHEAIAFLIQERYPR